jgi:transcriptional regulator with XRE-family HTH domain
VQDKLYIKYINIYGKIEYLPAGLGLRLIRRSQKLTMKEVSIRLGIHRNTLRNYECDKTRIPMSVLMRIMELYGIRLEVVELN